MDASVSVVTCRKPWKLSGHGNCLTMSCDKLKHQTILFDKPKHQKSSLFFALHDLLSPGRSQYTMTAMHVDPAIHCC